MITLANFGPDNRERRIGNSLYRICLEKKTKQWYIMESYNSATTWVTGKAYYHDLEKAIDALNGFTKECEIIKLGPRKANADKRTEAAKPMTVSPELFKQMLFDIVMESEEQISREIRDAILDVINRFDIGNPWRNIEENGKPASGEYFFIKLKKSAGYTDPCWRQPMLAKRMKGGFRVAERQFADNEVEAYSEVSIPK